MNVCLNEWTSPLNSLLSPARWTSLWIRSVPSWTRSPTSGTCLWLPMWIMGSPHWLTRWCPRQGSLLHPVPERLASQTHAKTSRNAALPSNLRMCFRGVGLETAVFLCNLFKVLKTWLEVLNISLWEYATIQKINVKKTFKYYLLKVYKESPSSGLWVWFSQTDQQHELTTSDFYSNITIIGDKINI